MSTGLHVVVGGGLSGVTAALRLADTGHQVMLLEARSRLGGVAGSGSRGGQPIDTGVHVMLRCYRRYRALLERLGVSQLVPTQPQLSIPVVLPGRGTSWLHRARHGPAPLHLLPTITRYRALSPIERVATARVLAALRRVSPSDPDVDDQSFGAFLAAADQSVRAVRRLWGLFSVAALNLEPAESSLALAAMTLQTALLESVDGADIGVPRTPLDQLHDRPARQALQRAGVHTLLGCRVLAMARDRELDLVNLDVRAGGEHRRVVADSVIVAVPHRDAARICPVDACPDRDRWAGLGASPIVNVHLHVDRRVTSLPFAATPESSTQWIFDRTLAAGVERGQYLVASVSAAERQIVRPAHELVAAQLDEVRDLFTAPGARLLDGFVTREPRATFRQAPGTARLRPQAATRWPRLALAGAWTDTGWPDTLEGAVLSGETAADVVAPSASGARDEYYPHPHPCDEGRSARPRGMEVIT